MFEVEWKHFMLKFVLVKDGEGGAIVIPVDSVMMKVVLKKGESFVNEVGDCVFLHLLIFILV